jgi:hypothetical protein
MGLGRTTEVVHDERVEEVVEEEWGPHLLEEEEVEVVEVISKMESEKEVEAEAEKGEINFQVRQEEQ